MYFFRPTIDIVTHDGNFHADDVFACATLSLWAQKTGKRIKIKRSRSDKDISKANLVVDVGMQYDPGHGRFDHHQKGGAGTHDNGIPYASFGLVWKHYGMVVCDGDKDVFKEIENTLVVPIDARDNGVNISITNDLNVVDHRTSNAISAFNPTWQEGFGGTLNCFEKALAFASAIIEREIAWSKAEIVGAEITKEATRSQGEPAILILERKVDWHKTVTEFKKIKFVIYPHQESNDWSIQVGRDDLEDYESDRIKFPLEWRGLRDWELASASGVTDAVFCIKGGWYAVARSKEGAIKMAEIALQKGQN